MKFQNRNCTNTIKETKQEKRKKGRGKEIKNIHQKNIAGDQMKVVIEKFAIKLKRVSNLHNGGKVGWKGCKTGVGEGNIGVEPE